MWKIETSAARILAKIRLSRAAALLLLALTVVPSVALSQNRNVNRSINRNVNRINGTLNGAGEEKTLQPQVRNLPAPPSQWPIDIIHKSGTMQPDVKSVRARIAASVNSPKYADPIVLRVLKKDAFSLLEQLGRDSYTKGPEGTAGSWTIGSEEMIGNLTKRLAAGKIALTPEDLPWLDLAKVSSVLKTKTALPEISLEKWDDALSDSEISYQLQIYFGSSYKQVRENVRQYRAANPDRTSIPIVELLPKGLRELYGRYSYLRGRNCFGTALEFANSRSVLDKAVNIEQEDGHFKTMINSDEFMRALWLGYYELKPQDILAGLKWGDVVVFYDDTPPVSWLSLRHAAVHLGNDIYFHKQSKSASSPIELTDWQSLINTWATLTPNLDYKVYRRLPDGKPFLTPTQAMEKLSWTR